MLMDLVFIVDTKDDGVDPTEKIENDDIINICWAIPTDKHTSELVEYEAGCATVFMGAPGQDLSTPDVQWTVTQTLTKILAITQTKIIPNTIIPAQSGAITKVIKLGEKDEEKDLYWQWVQEDNISEDTQLGFHLRRRFVTSTMTIKPGNVFQGKVGF